MIILDVTQQDKSKTIFIKFNICSYLSLIFRLLNGRVKGRRKQLNQIANLLEMTNCETNYAPCNTAHKQS